MAIETPILSQIIRAQTWDQIFPDDEALNVEFFNFLESECEPGCLVTNHRFDNLNGTGFYDIEGECLKRKIGINSDGELILTYGLRTQIIRPDVGNINHQWGQGKIDEMHKKMRVICEEEVRSHNTEMTVYGYLTGSLKGKLATREWEQLMIETGHLPQRIGFRIYSEAELRKSKDLLDGLA